MKLLLVICAVVLTAQCAPQFLPQGAPQIVPQASLQVNPVQLVNEVVPQFEMSPNGEYKFGYKTPDGQIRFEKGVLVERLGENGSYVKTIDVSGFYSFVGPDGVLNVNEYTSNADGFLPKVLRNGIPQVGLPTSSGQPVTQPQTPNPWDKPVFPELRNYGTILAVSHLLKIPIESLLHLANVENLPSLIDLTIISTYAQLERVLSSLTLADLAKIPQLSNLINIQNLPSIGVNLPSLSIDGNIPSLSNIANLPSLAIGANLPSLSIEGNIPSLSNVANLPSLSNVANLPSLSIDGNLPSLFTVGNFPGISNLRTSPSFRNFQAPKLNSANIQRTPLYG